MKQRNQISQAIQEGVAAIEQLQKQQNITFIVEAAQRIGKCFERGGKILIIGNGGSLCDAMHFAEELTGKFRNARPALPAIALSDPGFISCVSNDFGFHQVFARGVEALGRPEDLLISLTTSGNSQNIIEAVTLAKRKHMETIAFLGKDGGSLKGVCDSELIIEGFQYSDRIQEAHMTAIHIIIDQVEQNLASFFAELDSVSLCNVD